MKVERHKAYLAGLRAGYSRMNAEHRLEWNEKDYDEAMRVFNYEMKRTSLGPARTNHSQ
jgi:hypothetical protein